LKPAKGDASLNAFPEGTKRLLFVDSELGFLRSFKQFFQENGFELVSAKTGREALRVLASQPMMQLFSRDTCLTWMVLICWREYEWQHLEP